MPEIDPAPLTMDAFDYDLPPELIAQTPLEDRAASRLLHLERETGAIVHRQFRDLPQLLVAGDLIVLNDTRVTALRIFGRKETGGEVEALLLSESAPGEFVAIVRPARRLPLGTPISFEGDLMGVIVGIEPEGKRRIAFPKEPDLKARLAVIGQAPLPPYITTQLDRPERYQTVYASHGGSAAAPTAGLHFTQALFDELEANGVGRAFVTLDVGLDTFRPVQTENVAEHEMHGERCVMPESTAEAIAACRGRIVGIGTTSVRTLETFADGPRRVATGERVSKLFITPGYEFQIIDGMTTNFHMPRTTMLLMLAALAGRDRLMRAYEEALRERYRFLSFGDAMLIL